MQKSIYKLYCRTFQMGMKLGNYFLGYHTPECLEGAGCVTQLGMVLKERNVGKLLLVMGNTIRKRGLANGLLSSLGAAGIAYVIFSDLSPNPNSVEVEQGYQMYCREGCQGILAFGGGSPMDCAKAIGARVARPDKTVAQLQGVLKVRRRLPFFVAAPTTAGTGSETTIAAVITDSATHHKASINDPAVLPDLAVLDPELTMNLPADITAMTGMDALCHAVEAYTNHTYNTRLEDDLAKQAVRLIHDNLLAVYYHRSAMDDSPEPLFTRATATTFSNNGEEDSEAAILQARQNMQKAAFCAGRAFTRGCVGYVHAVGHTLSGLYGVPHGWAMAVLLPHVMRQYGSAVYERLAELAQVCGIPGNSPKEAAENFICWIEDLNRQMQIPAHIDIIQPEHTGQIIAWAMQEANPLYPVPVIWTHDDFARLLTAVSAVV